MTKERLADALGIVPQEVDAYLAGAKPLPYRAYLAALDIVAGGGA